MNRVERTFNPLLVLAGAWALFNGVGFVLNPDTRHRGESAWLILAGLLLVAGLSAARRYRSAPPPFDRSKPSWLAAAAFVLVALATYAPVMGIGLLSDDFVLLDRAVTGRFVDRTWEYVRPVPLAMWSVVSSVAPANRTASYLHALNVIGHGTNAWLVFEISRGFSITPAMAAAAALMFLLAPSNVEPVTWASGIFDVVLATCALGSVLVVIHGGGDLSPLPYG